MLMILIYLSLKIQTNLADEFRQVMQLADDNKMIINKTKVLVFRRPSSRRLHMFPSVNGIELVTSVKVLGV